MSPDQPGKAAVAAATKGGVCNYRLLFTRAIISYRETSMLVAIWEAYWPVTWGSLSTSSIRTPWVSFGWRKAIRVP